MMAEEHKVLLTGAVVRRARQDQVKQRSRLRRPFAKRDKQRNGAAGLQDRIRDLKKRCRFSGSRRRDNADFVERIQCRG
jgi:hypothetical protein